jgi:hypothetical protein
MSLKYQHNTCRKAAEKYDADTNMYPTAIFRNGVSRMLVR